MLNIYQIPPVKLYLRNQFPKIQSRHKPAPDCQIGRWDGCLEAPKIEEVQGKGTPQRSLPGAFLFLGLCMQNVIK